MAEGSPTDLPALSHLSNAGLPRNTSVYYRDRQLKVSNKWVKLVKSKKGTVETQQIQIPKDQSQKKDTNKYQVRRPSQ